MNSTLSIPALLRNLKGGKKTYYDLFFNEEQLKIRIEALKKLQKTRFNEDEINNASLQKSVNQDEFIGIIGEQRQKPTSLLNPE